jgi:hypothetical protein
MSGSRQFNRASAKVVLQSSLANEGGGVGKKWLGMWFVFRADVMRAPLRLVAVLPGL